MGQRDKLEERIKKKREEIDKLKIQILEAEAYISGLQDAMKYLPKDVKDETAEGAIRPGSKIYKTLNLLKTMGKPMHIDQILKALGLPVVKEEKVSLSGSLGWYVRKNQIFTRPAPNTFGLISMESDETDEPPDDFGVMEGENEELEEGENGKNRVMGLPSNKS